MAHPDATPGATGDPGTKTCPYCAETIRAAAVKCRYCQSDLSGPAPVPAAAQVAPAASPAARDTDAAPPPLQGPQRERRERGEWREVRWLRAATAVALVVTLVLLALAGWSGWERREAARAAESGQVARAAASDKIEALLTYRHETFDEDVAAAQELMTPSFQEEYAPTIAEIRKRALGQQRNQQAEVLAVGLVSAEEVRVRTLVFVNTLSARESGDAPPTVMQNRVTVDLVRSGDEWLVDGLSFPST